MSLLLLQYVCEGIIPSELGRLSQLHQLYLHENCLNGTRSRFYQCNTLYRLLSTLSQCPLYALRVPVLFLLIKGTIPSALGKLSKLTTLYLQFNSLTGKFKFVLVFCHGSFFSMFMYAGSIPSELGQLSELYHILMYNNCVQGISTSIHIESTLQNEVY